MDIREYANREFLTAGDDEAQMLLVREAHTDAALWAAIMARSHYMHVAYENRVLEVLWLGAGVPVPVMKLRN